MKSVIREAAEYLRKRGLYASEQDLKRAYWRQAKRHRLAGNTGWGAAEYLILNGIAKPAHKTSETSIS